MKMNRDLKHIPTGLYVKDTVGSEMCELYKVEDGTCLNEKQRDGLLDEVIGTIREFFGLRLVSINHIKNGEVNVTLLSDNKTKYTKSFSLIQIMYDVSCECDYNNSSNI